MEQKDLIEEQPGMVVKKRKESSQPDMGAVDPLIRLAVDKDFDLDRLTKLIDLREQERSRQAKQDFGTHFAAMQSEFTAVQRSKKGYEYKYAPIEVLQRHFGPVIAQHGFSYRWREETIDTGKRCTMIVSGWGHSEETYFDIPRLEGTKQMNAIQVAGAMSTYGRRYTFIAGFGVIIEDEDTDGTYDDALTYAEEIKIIRDCPDIEQLATIWKTVFENLKKANDLRGMKILGAEKDKRKKELGK